MGKFLPALAAIFAALAAGVSLLMFQYVMKEMPRYQRMSLYYSGLSASAEWSENRDGSINLDIKQRFYLFNRGDEPVRLVNSGIVWDSFGARYACFTTTEKSQTKNDKMFDTVIAPKQIETFEFGLSANNLNWRPGIKDLSECSEYTHLSTIVFVPHENVVLRFAQSRAQFLNAANAADFSELGGNNINIRLIYSNDEPWKDRWPKGAIMPLEATTEDEVKKVVLEDDKKQKPIIVPAPKKD